MLSFGATLYDAVEGGPPFPERQNQLALLRLVAEGVVQPPKQAGALTSLLMQLLKPDAADRPSMAQASRLLAELAGSKLPATVLAGVPRNPTKPDMVAPKPVEAAPAAAAVSPAATAATAPEPPTSSGVPSAAFLPGGTQLAEPPKQLSPVRKRALLIGAIVLVLVVAGVGIILANLGGGNGTGQNQAGVGGGQSTSNQQVPPASHTSTGNQPSDSSTAPSSPSGSSATTVASSGQIDYSAAGPKVVDFYSTNVLVGAGAQQGWNMLSTAAQQVYGSEAVFAAYWGQYQQISSSGEHPVSPNTDGSVQVPANVVYGPHQSSQTIHLSLRVVEVGGQLLLDGDTHIPGTSITQGNSNNGGANSQ